MSPRVYTKDEVRDKFLEHVRDMANYWATTPQGGTVQERCEGVAFSILAMLDGNSGALPGFEVIPHPHPTDKEYHKSAGENWFPDDCDIAGALHEKFYDRPDKV